MNREQGNPNQDRIREAVEKFEQPLIRYALRIVDDIDLARDVVQDTFLQLCRQPNDKIKISLKAWLYTVCRNRAFDVRKKEARMKYATDSNAESIQSREPNQAQRMEQRDTAHLASRLLNKLPDQQQEAIRMKIVHGLSYREISKVLDVSISHVGYLLHMGIKTIREQASH